MTFATVIITPLELPEIRTTIAKFLDRSDLVRCSYVCKAWHTSFLPLVWSAISIRSGERYPGVEAFNSHSQLIRTLTYDVQSWRAYESTHCRNVSTLRVYCNWDESPVITQYDQLRKLSIVGGKRSRHDVYTCWKPTNSFRNLSSLDLKGVDIDLDSTEDFWDLCTGLESLSVRLTNIARFPDKSMSFERLEKLVLLPRSGHSFEQRLEFITQCPNLVSLDWGRGTNGTPASGDIFAAHLAKGTWPRLCELRLPNFFSSDKQLGQIVHGMRQVKSLSVDGCTFGPLSLTAIRSHFSSLRQLTLQYTTYIGTGPSITPEVLVSCPQLEVLIAGEVTSEDILQGPPWVCERTLRTLHMSIIISPGEDMDHQQQLVLERISRLHHLENFGLLYGELNREATHINLRLGKGLEYLATLKKLRHLFLNSRSNYMTKDDVEWMLDNLKSLESVRGFLSLSDEYGSLAEMIRARGILHGYD
ncbi:MAG: hypothetical protein J3Q66DRAFT_33965 [Benniella sp.]|nr:MAG: hypothetical protein J3Q66DRAFT_33965 [Benniella sp.]